MLFSIFVVSIIKLGKYKIFILSTKIFSKKLNRFRNFCIFEKLKKKE